jgi:hypothetical protein
MADILAQAKGMAGNLGTAAIILGITLVVLLIIGVCLWLWFRRKRYSQFKVVLFEKDGFGQWNYKIDRAGIFLDRRTNNKRLFLEKGR